MQQPKNTRNQPVETGQAPQAPPAPLQAPTSAQPIHWPDGKPQSQKEIERSQRFFECDYKKRERAKEREAKTESDKQVQEAARDEITPLEVAKAFTEVLGADWRFDTDSERWLRWDDEAGHWRWDDGYGIQTAISKFLSGAIHRLADKLPASAIRETKRYRIIREAESYCRLESGQRVALSDHPFPAHLLQVPGALIDLRTGEALPPDRDLLATSCTSVAPQAPERGLYETRFGQFLEEIFEGDEAIIDHLHEWLGFCTTGEIQSQKLHYWLGEKSANGKSRLVGLLKHVLGDFAGDLAGEGLKQAYGAQHPCDLAALEHKRCVFASEVAGGAWNIARIKSLTGDDQVTARLMRQDFRTWDRQFKLIVTGNDMPALRQVDQAIRRRFLVLKFARHFSEAEADEALPAKLRADAPTVLWWLIKGAVKWYSRKLKAIPDQVRADTSEYLASEDLPSQWLEDRCQTGDRLCELAGSLYRDFGDWCSEQGAPTSMTSTAFGRWLKARGFPADKGTGGARIRRGLTLKET